MHLEALSRCTAQAAKLNAISGGQTELTRAELMAAISGCSHFATWWVQWKLLGDDTYPKRKLEGASQQLAKARLIQRNWYYESEQEKIFRLARISLKYCIDPLICHKCNQSPASIDTCTMCDGLGKIPIARVNKIAEIDRHSWRHRYAKKWEVIDSEVQQWIGSLEREVIRRVSLEGSSD